MYDGSPLQTDSRRAVGVRVALGVLLAVSALLYASGLDRVPMHLHHDEIYFGLNAHAIAETGRDPLGRFMPVLFRMGDTYNWYPPLIIYFNALWLKVLPLSDIAVRLPNACIGLIDIVLMFFVARRMFTAPWLAVAAAAMLASTPAHFINSRIATDSLYPVTFVLGWLWLIQRYEARPRSQTLLAATAVLGVGVYSYIGSVVTMPLYFLLTLGLLFAGRRPARAFAVSMAGFTAPLVVGLIFIALHPEVLGQYAAKYQLSAGPQLNVFQQLREALTLSNISDHLNLFSSAFSPGYLFVTGGSNLAHSTRTAGVFLAPLALLMTIGVIDTIARPTRIKVLVLLGFLFAPLASAIVAEPFAVPRMLALVAFGVLLATLGLQQLWQAKLQHFPRVPAVAAGAGLILVGLAYGAWMAIREGHLSASSIVLVAAGAGVWLAAEATARRQDYRVVTVVLAGLMAGQFAVFAVDYFGAYRARSAARYEYNIRGAIEQALAVHSRQPSARFYVNDDILFVRGYWDFYLRMLNRRDLLDKAVWFNSENGLPADVDRGGVIVTDTNDRAMRTLSEMPSLAVVAYATDPVPDSDPPSERRSFAIFQKQ